MRLETRPLETRPPETRPPETRPPETRPPETPDNMVHELFKRHCSDREELLRGIAALYGRFGQPAVLAAMIECAQIAYLRLRFSQRDGR